MFKFLSISSAVLALGAAVVVNGQSDSSFSLSQDCQSAIFSVLATPDAECLNSAGLVSIITGAVASPDASLVQPISGWLSGACAETACTNDALANMTTGLLTGCAEDLSNLGITDDISDVTSTVIPFVQQYYPTIQNIACLEETSNSTYCVSDMMADWEAAFGTLSVSAVESDVVGVFNGQSMTVPPSMICNECVQAAFSILEVQQSSLVSDSVDVSEVDESETDVSISSVLSSQCGSDFISSPSPTDVVVATGTLAAENVANGALSTVSGGAVMGMALSSLGAVMAAFFLLA